MLLPVGVLVSALDGAINREDDKALRAMLAALAAVAPADLVKAEIAGARPFRHIRPDHILREIDHLWEQSMLQADGQINYDIRSAVSVYRGDLWLRWTLPSPTSILLCKDPRKLVYTCLTVIEELLHIRQITALNSRWFVSLQLELNLSKLNDVEELLPEKKELLTRLREADVTQFLRNILPDSVMTEQWFHDRAQNDSLYRELTYVEMLRDMMTLTLKYGDPLDFAAQLQGMYSNYSGNAQLPPELIEAKQIVIAFMYQYATLAL